MINYLKPLLFKVSDFTYKINKMIPKKKNRIVLYSNWGFRDNLRTLYHYLVDNDYQETYEIVCASNDFYHLEKENDVKYVSIYRGFFYFLTSNIFSILLASIPSNLLQNRWLSTCGMECP